MAADAKLGAVLSRADLVPLRPCPEDGISPADFSSIVGKKLTRNVVAGEHLTLDDIE